MARRRKKTEDHVNHERWLVSYADFITLLFAFFVVMYAVSSINAGKYRVLSASLVNAFRSTSRTLRPIQLGELSRSQNTVQTKIRLPDHIILPPYPGFPGHRHGRGLHTHKFKSTGGHAEQRAKQHHDAVKLAQAQHIQVVAKRIELALRKLIEEKLVLVKHNASWVEVNINTSVLFPSGSTVLSAKASDIIERLANILKSFPDRINVEGFTDDRPISTPAFPSNWELSAARAASVVHRMTATGVNPEHLAAIGYGKYHPVADNDTVEGRAQNRRVALIIMAAAADDRKAPPFDQSFPPPPLAAAP